MSEGPSQPNASCAAFLAKRSTSCDREAKGESATTHGATPLGEKPVFFAPASMAATAPIDLPYSATWLQRLFAMRCDATEDASPASRRPNVTNSPSDEPEPV